VAIAVGTVVFHLLEGWSIVDSLYVTAQTLTTVGYGDVAPHTVYGRIFATGFMLAGVGIVLYALTSTVQSIVQSEMLLTLGQLRHSLKMSKLRDHFIICGAGRVGSHLIRGLKGTDDRFIVIESDRKKVEEQLVTKMGEIEKRLTQLQSQNPHAAAATVTQSTPTRPQMPEAPQK